LIIEYSVEQGRNVKHGFFYAIQLCRGLEQHKPSLDLERASPNSDFDGMLIHYHQGNVTASRKVILPVLRSAMSSQGGRSSPLPTPRMPNGIHLGAASQLLSVTTTTDLGSSVVRSIILLSLLIHDV
jgi:DHHA2 domain